MRQKHRAVNLELLTCYQRSVVALLTLVVCGNLSGCLRYDEEEAVEKRQNLTLEDIKRQLDQPLRAAQTVTPIPKEEATAGRWKAYGNRNNAPNVDQEKQLSEVIVQSQSSAPWPPEVGHQFPTMAFLSAAGHKRSIDEFRGKLALIEYVWMGSSATQAMSGSRERGPFGAVPMTKKFNSLEKYFPQYSAGIQAGDVTLIQILMVDTNSRPVSKTVAEAWLKHFDLESRGRIVLVGTPALLRNGGSGLLGGFQLLDKNLVVRFDATRERSKTLFSELFPAMARIRDVPQS